MVWVLEFDGAADRNGSPDCRGGYGWRLVDDAGAVVASGSGPVPRYDGEPVTCNTAEFTGVLDGLRWVVRLTRRPDTLIVRGDSQLVVNVLARAWKAKRPLLGKLRDACLDRLAVLGVPWRSEWVPREQNEACDRLSKHGLSGDLAAW